MKWTIIMLVCCCMSISESYRHYQSINGIATVNVDPNQGSPVFQKVEVVQAPSYAAPIVQEIVQAPQPVQVATPIVQEVVPAPQPVQIATPIVQEVIPAPQPVQLATPIVQQVEQTPIVQQQAEIETPFRKTQFYMRNQFQPITHNNKYNNINHKDMCSTYGTVQPAEITIPASSQPINIKFHSQSSPINVRSFHIPAQASPVQFSTSQDTPDILKHEIIKPIIQEITEKIQPIRKITQEIRPVQETINQVLTPRPSITAVPIIKTRTLTIAPTVTNLSEESSFFESRSTKNNDNNENSENNGNNGNNGNSQTLVSQTTPFVAEVIPAKPGNGEDSNGSTVPVKVHETKPIKLTIAKPVHIAPARPKPFVVSVQKPVFTMSKQERIAHVQPLFQRIIQK
ncbi:hypothetical protein RDWZM_006537 [Blomia tropicalis]|uniref:Uncharacterized protein n=1 Tax=Blomia tropicalis TaxID=40697 RepID=A0A9Q0M7X3_BLOTA|nr:hypothetical protein RDWZM_006537 [Blomia tropicalis]